MLGQILQNLKIKMNKFIGSGLLSVPVGKCGSKYHIDKLANVTNDCQIKWRINIVILNHHYSKSFLFPLIYSWDSWLHYKDGWMKPWGTTCRTWNWPGRMWARPTRVLLTFSMTLPWPMTRRTILWLERSTRLPSTSSTPCMETAIWMWPV